MKKSTILLTATLALSFASCDETAEDKTQNSQHDLQNTTIDSSKYQSVDLHEYNIDRTILIQSGASAQENIQQTAVGNVEISAGDRYIIEVVPNPLGIEEKKLEIEANPLYQITYVDESANSIFYSKEIEDSGIEPEFHFYILLDDGNETIAVQSSDMLQLKKDRAQSILESFKVQERKPA